MAAPAQTMTLEDAIASIPPEQAKEVLSKLEQRAKEAKKEKTPFSWDEFEMNYILKPCKYVDGLTGSFARSFATTYGSSIGLGVALANPLVGIPLMATMALTSYVSANTLHKMAMGSVKFTYNVALHPITSVKKALKHIPVIGWIAKLASKFNLGFLESAANKLDEQAGKKGAQSAARAQWEAQEEARAPKGVTGFFFKHRNDNQLGRILGGSLGGLGALQYVSPDLFNATVGRIVDVVGPVATGAKEGISLYSDKMYGLGKAMWDTAKNYTQYNILPSPAYAFAR